MSQLSLFGDDPESEEGRPAQAARLAPKLAALAARGVYFGTSSWKYPGWVGSVYSGARYAYRGKFSEKRFNETCLSEYALTFPVVGGDFSFYQFPSPPYWQRLFGESPSTLRFALKVPEEITAPRWPSHARYGPRAGQANTQFLHPGVFEALFLRRLAPYRDRVAVLMFEFGTFAKRDFATPAEFVSRLDGFLKALPPGFRYAVEIRNPEVFGSEYLDMLRSNGVSHVFNAWTRMPELPDQVAEPGAIGTADFLVARALLARGHGYEEAVDAFQPYDRLQTVNHAARAGLRQLGQIAMDRKIPAFLLVNNRLEGHSPSTIEAVADELLM
jgi:uncharacterized protein YecE (DUF72 family)